MVSLSWLLMQWTEELSGNSPSYCLHKQQWDSQGKVTLPWEIGSFFFSCWNKQSDQYQSGGGKHFFWVIDNSPPLRKVKAGTQGRSLDPKSWGTPDYWLVSRLTFSHLPYLTKAHLPHDGTTLRGMRSLITITIQQNGSQTCPQDYVVEVLTHKSGSQQK